MYGDSLYIACLGFGGLCYNAVATRRQLKSLEVREEWCTGGRDGYVDPLRLGVCHESRVTREKREWKHGKKKTTDNNQVDLLIRASEDEGMYAHLASRLRRWQTWNAQITKYECYSIPGCSAETPAPSLRPRNCWPLGLHAFEMLTP